MTPTVRLRLIVMACACAAVLPLVAAELEETTRRAYDEYVSNARQRFLEKVQAKESAPSADREATLRTGRIVVGPGSGGGIIGIPKGLVHHWAGAAFMPDVTLDEVLRVSQAYERYHAIYESVVSSRLVRREGDTYFLELRAREGVRGVTVVLDVRSSVQYVYPNSRFAYALSATHEIREVKRAGSPDEHHLPPGHDSGYLWAASTFTMFTQRDNGVYVELETFGLSRRFPPVMGWILQPIVRRLGRKSVEGSLDEFRTAILAGHDAKQAESSAP
jgi:hypothetical protein